MPCKAKQKVTEAVRHLKLDYNTAYSDISKAKSVNTKYNNDVPSALFATVKCNQHK